MAQLGRDQIVTIQVLKGRGAANTHIARILGVSEGTVRYHLRRQASGQPDQRKQKISLIQRHGLVAIVEHWWRDEREHLPADRSPNVTGLWQMLVDAYDYPGSCKSVRKYVREHLPKPKLRPFRRIETPPGAQTQSDWLEMTIDLGHGPQRVYGFTMVLSHSRKTALVWSTSMTQLSWHRVHNLAFQRLGGIAAVNRIDNLKTGVSRGAGAWGTINPRYQAYAQLMGFHVDPHQVRAPYQKGKTERRVGWIKTMGLDRLCFEGLEHLQAYTDQKLTRLERKRLCPATGQSIAVSWQSEKRLLRPLPALLPEPFDAVRDCPVHKDCTIRFEGRTYAVPFKYVHQRLEVRGCAEVVQMVDKAEGQIVGQYPRHTQERLLLDTACYEGESTESVRAPIPLGKMSRKLQQIAAQEPQVRSIEMYAMLAEVAR